MFSLICHTFCTAIISLIFIYLLNRYIEIFFSRKITGYFYQLIRLPIQIITWSFAFSYILNSFNSITTYDLNYIIQHSKDISLIVSCSMLMWELTIYLQHYIKKQKQFNRNMFLDISLKTSKIVLVVITSLTIVETVGIKINGILALGSISGLVFGIAAKDIIANFFGATFIYLDGLFQVGDWIRSSDKNIEGHVEYISWRLTKIRTFDKKPLFVPNAIFNSVILENASRMSHRRIKELIFIRYQDIDKIIYITKDIKKMLVSHIHIDNEQNIIVNLSEYGASSIHIFLCAFTKVRDWSGYQNIKQDILLKVSEIIKSHGSEIAYPTHVVLLDKK